MSPCSLATRALPLIAAGVLAACGSTPNAPSPSEPPAQATVEGWEHCLLGVCGRSPVSAYSTLTFVRVDDEVQDDRKEVTVPAGRHWFEVRHTWGAGVLTGIGNWNNFGFELDVEPGHRYRVDALPTGCVVPMSQRRVNRKSLGIVESAPGAQDRSFQMPTMEFCNPADTPGTCRTDRECKQGRCVPFEGALGYGMCSDREQ